MLVLYLLEGSVTRNVPEFDSEHWAWLMSMSGKEEWRRCLAACEGYPTLDFVGTSSNFPHIIHDPIDHWRNHLHIQLYIAHSILSGYFFGCPPSSGTSCLSMPSRWYRHTTALSESQCLRPSHLRRIKCRLHTNISHIWSLFWEKYPSPVCSCVSFPLSF